MTGYEKLRARVYETLSSTINGEKKGKYFDYFLMAVIAADIIAIIADSVESLEGRYGQLIISMNRFAVIVYISEYILRIWSCSADPRYSDGIAGRVRFALTPLLVIDMLAILPFFISFFWSADLSLLRFVRVARLIQILKITRYNRSIQIFTRALNTCKNQLIMTGFLVVVVLLILSGLVYYAENPYQPARFADIPETIYWATLTMTTVGYGDIVPITTLGRLGAILISVSGIVAFALITGILSSAFFEEYEQLHKKKERAPVICPHCGRNVTDGGPKSNEYKC